MTVVQLPEGSWWDWDLLGWNGSELSIAAGHDLTYHHGVELVFTDVHYLACPTRFSDPQFREPTSDEYETVRAFVGEVPPAVVAFDVEAVVGWKVLPCVVAAASVRIVTGLVYRYWREDLKEGERLASFLRRPDGGQ
ncbi:hypothetical protein ACLQ22_22945 [Micromonospora sp. DT178]|uniref:hypothetical protein n=1 Tax=Micromonospora sp. DT178 TaxID=3393436 RepID=UPI003CEBCDDA